MSVLTPTANKIRPSGSGVDSSWDCCNVDHILVDFDNGRVTWINAVWDEVLRVQHLLHKYMDK